LQKKGDISRYWGITSYPFKEEETRAALQASSCRKKHGATANSGEDPEEMVVPIDWGQRNTYWNDWKIK